AGSSVSKRERPGRSMGPPGAGNRTTGRGPGAAPAGPGPSPPHFFRRRITTGRPTNSEATPASASGPGSGTAEMTGFVVNTSRNARLLLTGTGFPLMLFQPPGVNSPEKVVELLYSKCPGA